LGPEDRESVNGAFGMTPEQIAAFRELRRRRIEASRARYGKVFTRSHVDRLLARFEAEQASERTTVEAPTLAALLKELSAALFRMLESQRNLLLADSSPRRKPFKTFDGALRGTIEFGDGEIAELTILATDPKWLNTSIEARIEGQSAQRLVFLEGEDGVIAARFEIRNVKNPADIPELNFVVK
jgi:hypothetical protein